MKPTTTTPPDLDEEIAALEDQIYNLDQQLRAKLAERAKRDDVMRHARSDPQFVRWQAQRQQRDDRGMR